jgi:antitoxin HicB
MTGSFEVIDSECVLKTWKKKVHKYTTFFESTEHGGYTVTVPALPGLVTEGKDLEHARNMTKDAACCYNEGLKRAKEPVPLERESVQVKSSVVA